MVGNLLGDPLQNVVIGADVVGVFEHHPDSHPAYSLLQWRVVDYVASDLPESRRPRGRQVPRLD